MTNTQYIMLLCMVFISFFGNESFAQNQTVDGNVTIGRQGNDCRGRGFCSFSVDNKSESNATIIFNKDDSITMVIKLDKLSEESQTKLETSFTNKTSDDASQLFEMEEDFELPSNIISLQKSANSLTKIPKGAYEMEIKEGNYIITFKLE